MRIYIYIYLYFLFFSLKNMNGNIEENNDNDKKGIRFNDNNDINNNNDKRYSCYYRGERKKAGDNPYNVYLLHNQIRLCFFSHVNFNKTFHEYHKKYEENVIKPLANINLQFFGFDEKTFFYIISKNDNDFQKISKRELEKVLSFDIQQQKQQPPTIEKIYLISQETYYKIKAIKLIIAHLLDYDDKLTEYEHYLRHKIQSLITAQQVFRNIYDYTLNIVNSNGNEYNADFENLLEDFSMEAEKNEFLQYH